MEQEIKMKGKEIRKAKKIRKDKKIMLLGTYVR
jgi:ribosome-associated protein YbcJ (S4-like RNA binding protein)